MKAPDAWKSKKIADMMQLITIEKDVAKTFRTLSAYFTTTATISPPTAWTMTTVQTRGPRLDRRVRTVATAFAIPTGK